MFPHYTWARAFKSSKRKSDLCLTRAYFKQSERCVSHGRVCVCVWLACSRRENICKYLCVLMYSLSSVRAFFFSLLVSPISFMCYTRLQHRTNTILQILQWFQISAHSVSFSLTANAWDLNELSILPTHARSIYERWIAKKMIVTCVPGEHSK